MFLYSKSFCDRNISIKEMMKCSNSVVILAPKEHITKNKPSSLIKNGGQEGARQHA